jgi:peptidoglycan hydrolase-like protein with peptidoglycan-binding domain
MTVAIFCVLCGTSGNAQQDPQQVIAPFIDFMNRAIEESQRQNSPEYQYQQIQPGGLTRAQVVMVQQLLRQRGYDVGEPDGIVGPKTMTVVGQLQVKAGLSPTGLPDQQLLSALLAGN